MNEQAKIREKLIALLQKGSIPKSSCSKALADFLRPALDAGVVIEERSSAGRRLVVQNPERLSERLQLAFPGIVLQADAPSRVTGVALYRDSKVLNADTADILTLRAWSDTSFWRDGALLSIAGLTKVHGVFSFVLDNRARYELRGPWALVEGPVMLLNFERLGHECPAVIYGNGRISGRVLSWLVSQAADDFRLVHFPDYDPVGLSEFMRLRQGLGARADLFIPEGLGERFARFSKRSLLDSPASQAVLRRVRSSRIPEVRTVLELIHQNNAGLEQEQLFIPLSSRA